MKKLMTALAVCLAAGFVAASGASVVSSNIVGYVKTPVTGSAFEMYGVSFRTIGTTNVTLAALMDPNSFATSDIIFMLNTSGGYDQYTYVTQADAGDAGVAHGGWWTTIGDSYVYVGDTVVNPGAAFWLNTGANGTVLSSGEVVNGLWTRTVAGNEYSMVSCPFPMDYLLSSFTYVGQTSDIIFVLNIAGGYDQYTYIAEADAGDAGVAHGGWWTSVGDTYVYDANLQACNGFWVYPLADATFSMNLSL